MVRGMVEEAGTEHIVPLPQVNKTQLDKVLDFCTHYAAEPMPEILKPLKTDDIKTVVPQWYGNYINLDIEDLYQIIIAANYLEIQPLLDLGSAAVAAMMRGKSFDQIRDIFGIENDFTAEQEEQNKQELKWAEELA